MCQFAYFTDEVFLVLFGEIVDYDVLASFDGLEDACHKGAITHASTVYTKIAVISKLIVITI